MRDYETMRSLLTFISKSNELPFYEFSGFIDRSTVVDELKRMKREGLISSSLEFNGDICLGGSVYGLTDCGADFLRMIEQPDVWRICIRTLKAAGVDMPYPLLKDICETIARRYVEKFIE